MTAVSICAIADVHMCCDGHPYDMDSIPTSPANILTVSGDLTIRGGLDELQRFREWLDTQPHRHKVVIAGNHDFCLEDKRRLEAESILKGPGITYIRDEMVVIDGVKIYGSPWQPWFHDWAFNVQRGHEIRQYWKKIPENLDVLLVHGPPYGRGDKTLRGEHVGCVDLMEEIMRKKPKYVCYGHIHEDIGVWDLNTSKCVNVSVGYHVGWHDMAERRPYVFSIDPSPSFP